MQPEVTRKSQYLLTKFQELCLKNNITIAELAIKTGYREDNIRRIMAGKYSPKLDLFIELLEAAGYKLSIE